MEQRIALFVSWTAFEDHEGLMGFIKTKFPGSKFIEVIPRTNDPNHQVDGLLDEAIQEFSRRNGSMTVGLLVADSPNPSLSRQASDHHIPMMVRDFHTPLSFLENVPLLRKEGIDSVFVLHIHQDVMVLRIVLLDSFLQADSTSTWN